MATRGYAIVIEGGTDGEGYSGYAPAVSGLGVTGETKEQVRQRMAEALELHFEDLAARGVAIPEDEAVEAYILEVSVTEASART